MRTRGFRTLTTLVLAATLALAGCGASDDDNLSGDQVLVYGHSTIPNNLDPHKTLFSGDCVYLCTVYDRLIHINPDGTLAPGLAETWAFSSDGTTFTLKIRDGVTFKDGTVLDAEGVKSNLERARSLDDSAVKTDLEVITSVDTPDAHTVVLSLKTPTATLPGILSGLAGAMINPTALANGTDLSKTPDGAGPFEFVSYTTGSEFKVKPRDDYWGGKPSLAGIDFKIIPDNAALANALRAGQIDAAQILPANLKAFEGNNDYTEKTITTLYQAALVSNFKLAGLTDVRVRQALLHAIDRQSICDEVLSGYCEVSDQPFPESYFAHDDSIDTMLYDYDPDEARRLLADAGATDLEIKAIVPSQQFMPLAQTIQSYLEAVGVKLTTELVDGSSMAQQAFVDKTAPMVITTFGGRPDPAQLFTVRYSEAGFYNPGGFTTPKMQSLFTESLATTDPDKRLPIIKAGAREAAESAIAMMLYSPTDVYVMRKGVDFEPFVTGIPELKTATVTR